MDGALHWMGNMRFRWLLLGAVAVGCSLNPQPDLPAPRDGAAPIPDGGTPPNGEGTAGSVGSGAASSGGSVSILDPSCQGGAGGECDESESPGNGGVPASAGAGTVNAKDAGAAGSEGGDGG